MSRQIAVALVALAVLIGATLAADRVVAAPVEPTPAFTEQVQVNSGTWYCMPIVGDGETATLTIAAVGDDASRVRVQHFADGEAQFEDTARELAPEATAELEVEGGEQPPAVVIRWRGGPVVASWTFDDSDGLRRGATCSPNPAPRWLLSGAETTVGSSTRLYLFNPFETDAVVRVAYATPEGRLDLVSSENVSVPAREVVDLDITKLQPEQPDLGLLVEVEAGRVIASGLQDFGQPDLPEVELEGADVTTDPTAPEGPTVLPATAVDATSAAFAYAASGESTTSWISVVNPNDRAARLEVTASDQIEGGAATQEVVIGPESADRIELEGASSAPDYGVVVRSTNDVTFVANGFMALTGDDKAVTAMPGVTEPDQTNVEAAAPDGTAPELALFNPGEVTATVSVDVGGSAPDQWSALELGPDEMRLLPFDEAGLSGGAPVDVTSDQPIYGAVRLARDDGRAQRLLNLPLVPANAWSGSSDAPVPQRDRTLGTSPVDFPVQQR